MRPNTFSRASSVAYGLAMFVSLTYFAWTTPELLGIGVFWIVSITAFLASFVLGWHFGRWYIPVEGENPSFELFVCPVLVMVFATAGGLIVFWCVALVTDPTEPDPFMGLLVVLAFGFGGFLEHAWPAIIASFGMATWFLARFGRTIHA